MVFPFTIALADRNIQKSWLLLTAVYLVPGVQTRVNFKAAEMALTHTLIPNRLPSSISHSESIEPVVISLSQVNRVKRA